MNESMRQVRAHGILFSTLLILGTTATCADAGFRILGSTLDEVVERQSVPMESAFFGPIDVAGGRDRSLSVHPAAGVYGDEGISSGISLAWYRNRTTSWDLGLGVSRFDLEFDTWTLGVSSARQVWHGDTWDFVLGGATAVQFSDFGRGEEVVVPLDERGPSGVRGLLLDSARLLHVWVRAEVGFDLWFLRPIVDVGWVGTRHRFEGETWDSIASGSPGDRRVESGNSGKATMGAGVSIDVDQLLLFAGIRASSDVGSFQAGLGWRY